MNMAKMAMPTCGRWWARHKRYYGEGSHYVRVEYLIDILESGLLIMTTGSKITAMYLTWIIIWFGFSSAQSRDFNGPQTLKEPEERLPGKGAATARKI